MFGDSVRDLLPIIVVIAFFQFFVLKQPIPNLVGLLVGTVFVIMGLSIFIRGLNMALFPLGEALAYDFARKGSVLWLLLFAFEIGRAHV